jgi:hypothetical protein
MKKLFKKIKTIIIKIKTIIIIIRGIFKGNEKEFWIVIRDNNKMTVFYNGQKIKSDIVKYEDLVLKYPTTKFPNKLEKIK